ncbi:cell division protein ZipA [Agaribacterium sp. ZY112]|uniref:cell division protein ZipA n=1 Tax=Agaribacterium sp. ZY112 TaxID=3233574 RepID=UPI003524B715
MSDTVSVIIVILIIAIVLDGIRRARKGRGEKVKLSANARRADKLFGEQDSSEATSIVSPARKKPSSEAAESVVHKQKISAEPVQNQLDLDEPVPMLMDSVVQEESEPKLGELSDLDEILGVDQVSTSSSTDDLESSLGLHSAAAVQEGAQADRLVTEKRNSKKEEKKKESLFSSFSSKSDEKSEPVPTQPEELLIINVMSPKGLIFNGDALLAALTDVNMKFGQRGIFNRHLDNDADGAVLYSAANMIEPGNFDLSSMNESQTPGICLFLTLPCAGEGVQAYDDLVRTAKSIAEQLGGELKDENRSTLTNQSIEHGRQRVIEFERKQKLYK